MAVWPPEKVVALVERLEAQYGQAAREAVSDPLEELVSCILSQHTTDVTSFPTYDRLRERFPTWKSMEAAGEPTIADVIRKAGLANQKARSIYRCLVAIREHFGSHTLSPLLAMTTPDARQFLESLPGVGPKTAAIVLCFALGRDVVPVDTHVYRVAMRLGLTPPVGEAKAHPVLDARCPPGYAFRLHMALIAHGRATCKAPVPRCPECVVAEFCAFATGRAVPRVVPHYAALIGKCMNKRVAEKHGLLTDELAGVQRAYETGLWNRPKTLQALASIASAADQLFRRPSDRMRYPHGAIPDQWERERKRSRNLYAQVLRGKENRDRVGDALGAYRKSGLAWVDAFPNPEGVLDLLLNNEEAFHRFCTVVESAPDLMHALEANTNLSSQILSGEIEAQRDLPTLSQDASPASLASTLRAEVNRRAIRWVLNPSGDLAQELAECYDWFLRYVCGRLCINIDVLALGSYGTKDLTLGSDLDVAVLVRDTNHAGGTETAAFVGFIANLNKHGAPIRLDFGMDSMLREREGPATVRTYDALKQYELESMGMAERFGLGHARLIWGDSEADTLLQRTAYAVPLTPERLRELVTAKRRYEAEDVQPKHRHRDIKRGLGGLSDIEWFVHLHELRFPTATLAGTTVDIDQRIQNIASARLINSVERDELLEARRHLREVRHRLILLGLTRDVVPENPDKLSRLAHIFGYADGNDFLSYHERVTGTVRSIYEDGLERLKV